MTDINNLRAKILNLCGEYAEEVFNNNKKFVKGKTQVPVSGKLINNEEIQFAVDSCLDGWFTTGRFADEF